MRLVSLQVERFLSLRDVSIEFGALNVLIGANAAGKSNILTALGFLHEGVRDGDFVRAVGARGRIQHLAWKGEEASVIAFKTDLEHEGRHFRWRLALRRSGAGFEVSEESVEETTSAPPRLVLSARHGRGWWLSAEGRRVELQQDSTECALKAAAKDASFPARHVAAFVETWRFFDPAPSVLRRAAEASSSELDAQGWNLAAVLKSLRGSDPSAFERIVTATRDVLGVPSEIDFLETEDGRVFFVQREPGLQYRVHQIGASSGTLRMLALMTALLAPSQATLIGIEEPENYVHPSALAAFARHLSARKGVQVVVTTHSPVLLDCLDDPAAILVVRRDSKDGTVVLQEKNPDAVRRALIESGYGLGEFHETKGFGA